MEDKLKLYQAIAERERASRKVAEKLLEEKSLQLYEHAERTKKARCDVESLNMHLTNLMASAPDGIITCSKKLKILNLNVTAERQLKLSREAALGKQIELFVPDLRQKIIEQGKAIFEINETSVTPINGDPFTADVRGRLGERGKETYFVFFIHDITKRLIARKEKAQMHLQFDEARRLEAIGALSAGIAHEINTPIQYIGDNLGYLQDSIYKIHQSYLNYATLSAELNGDKNLQKLVDVINRYNSKIQLPVLINEVDEAIKESLEGINQVRDIILLMKEFAHPGGGESDETNINEIIQGVIKITNSSHRSVAALDLQLCETLPPIRCRRNQIRQVILNMVINAVDAIEETGRLPGRLRIETRTDETQLHIIISDTGSGIPDSLYEKVFDPFFTTKPVGKGTGQGLALAKDFIVTGHNGELNLINIDGYATSFQISLPLNPSADILLETHYAA